MNDINRKKMNDVIVPKNEIVRRPVIVPEERPSMTPRTNVDRDDHLDNNPFFEKLQHKKMGEKKTKTNGTKGILWSLLFVIFLAGGFVVANYFATATVSISPITRNAKLDNDFAAVKAGSGDGLVFQFATSTEEETKEIDATLEKKIQVRASGKVVIYNAYSAASQKLIKNTRLEDNVTHKIFRIDNSITVPGAKMASGKVVTPGSVEAIVYADVAGEEYNIGTSNFTIPGFKGDPRYTKFTASSKPDSPIAGGYSGTVKVPTDEAIAQAREEIKQDLKKIVVEKARADIPESTVFFPGSMVIKFEEVPQDYSSDNAAKVTVRAVSSVFFFDTALLTQKLADAVLPDDSGKVFEITNMSSLVFTFIDPVDNVVLSDISKLRFHIAGSPVFAGLIDGNKIRTELAGKDKKDFGTMIANQSNIHTADATIRPVWKTVFPSDPAKITVKVLTK